MKSFVLYANIFVISIFLKTIFAQTQHEAKPDNSEDFCYKTQFSGLAKCSVELIRISSIDINKIIRSKNVEISNDNNKLKIDYDATDPNPGIQIPIPEKFSNLTGYLFVTFNVKNLSINEILVTARLNGEMAAAGAQIIPAERTGEVKIFVPQNKGLPGYINEVFLGMRGWPGSMLLRPVNFDVREIENILIKFPNPSGTSSLEITNIRAEDGVHIFSQEELADGFFPFVDKFGQYKHKDWEGKVFSIDQLKESIIIENADLYQNHEPKEWNKYGGWVGGPKLNATGSFRTEKYQGKWWLVDPEGRLFWSHGIVAVLLKDDNPITSREHYFDSLPPRNEFPEFYHDRKVGNTTSLSRYRNQVVTSFYIAEFNQMRKYGESWQVQMKERTNRRLKSWGINTMGAWTSREMTWEPVIPYTIALGSSGRRIEGSESNWTEFPDPFDEGFKMGLANRLTLEKETTASDPYCIGYFIDNELAWGSPTHLAESTLKSPPDQPAKMALREFLIKKYLSINALNNTWNSNYITWDDFMQQKSVPDNAGDDLIKFNKKIVQQYFSICRDELRNAAPNKLYLGARFDFHMYPLEDSTKDWLIEIAAKYCDVISFNRYQYSCLELIPPKGVDVPLMITEWHMGTMDRGMFHFGVRFASSLEQQADLYKYYVRQALKNPYLVGTHWFKYSDQSLTGRLDGENLRIGFVDICDRPYQELINASREVASNLYEFRSNGIIK
jgi:hypothetical protein